MIIRYFELVGVAWMTPQICLLGLLRCSSLAITEHWSVGGWNVRGLREVLKRRSQRGSHSSTQRDPHQKAGDRCRTGICISHLWIKFLDSFMSEGSDFIPPLREEGHTLGLCTGPKPLGLKQAGYLLLPALEAVALPHHIHPAGQVERWVP